MRARQMQKIENNYKYLERFYGDICKSHDFTLKIQKGNHRWSVMGVDYVGTTYKTPFNTSVIQERASALHQKPHKWYI